MSLAPPGQRYAHLGHHKNQEPLFSDVACLNRLVVGQDLAAVDDLLLFDCMTFLRGDL